MCEPVSATGIGVAELMTYVASLEAVNVAEFDRAEQFAFWANI
jgi:hypothetical protein